MKLFVDMDGWLDYQYLPRRSVKVPRKAWRASLEGKTGPMHSNSSWFLSFTAVLKSSSDIAPSRSTSSFFINKSIKS